MTAVGLGQHGSEAVGIWFESLSCQITLRFRIVTPPRSTPLIHKSFGYQEFSETPKGSPTNFFGTVRLKFFDGKSWYPPIMHKIFRYPKFSETLKGSPRNFSALWDKKFPTEKRDTPPLLHNFSIQEIFWNIEGFPYEFFRYCEPKNSRRKFVLPLTSSYP